MKLITAFKANDGTIFESAKEAIEYEETSQIKRNIGAWVYKYCFSAMGKNEIAEAIFDDRESLMAALKGDPNYYSEWIC